MTILSKPIPVAVVTLNEAGMLRQVFGPILSLDALKRG
jgi:hypothetical protein